MLDFTFSLYDIEYFLLILVRIASFIAVAPFFGLQGVPARVKIGFSFCISIIIFEITDYSAVVYSSLVGYALIVIKEVLVGLAIGLGANICTYIVGFAGHMVDMNIGLSMAQEYNPMTRTQESVSGNMYYYTVMLILLVSNMYHYILRAITDSFVLIPINTAFFNWDSLAKTFLTFSADVFILGFRIMLPVYAVILTVNCILGIMARVSPQMNMFAVGMQIKVLIGYVLLLVCAMMLPSIANLVASEIRKVVEGFVQGMLPIT